MSASCLAQARINHENIHFRFRLYNADVLLDSGLKLSNIIVILCSKLLDYILLKSGSISGSYYIYSGSKYYKRHV